MSFLPLPCYATAFRQFYQEFVWPPLTSKALDKAINLAET